MTETTVAKSARLAIHGGSPVRRLGSWPTWPLPAKGARQLLSEVLDSGRWAISSPLRGGLFERQFARMFADYTGTRRCVPVDHGSSALVVALEALDLEFGEPVLVPALTWVACASAVLRAGLTPVLVDVEPDTGCVGPDALGAVDDARALIAVHWASAMADMPALSSVATSRGVEIIEDCAQAHGARWQDRPAGSFGRLGCFSFQNGKVLTCGEGGAVVTDDPALAVVLEELRADSRSYPTYAVRLGELELAETAGVQGANFCLNEFGSAVLCAQLRELDSQHEIRNRNYALLGELIADLPGVRLLPCRPGQSRMSIYEGTVVFDPLPGGMLNSDVATALTAELGVRFYVTDDPLHRSRLLSPGTKRGMSPLARRYADFNEGRQFPNADFLADHSVQTHHSTFLGSQEDMADIARAIRKVIQYVPA
jgi:dTDP-4-amino-4,6-dideoxygalactose transaminase